MKRRPEPFGKAGLTVAVVALVFALIGGAYAAGGLTKAQEKQVTKIAKKYAGKPGATGPAGINGTNGKDGAPGGAGAAGVSVAASVEPKGANCKEGGSNFVTGASTTYACNGEKGKQGEEGSPWVAGGTLPSGQTETGFAAATEQTPTAEALFVPISFPIPLAQGISGNVHFVKANSSGGTECPGSAQEPQALPGNLCIYALYSSGVQETSDGEGPFIAPDTPALFEVVLDGKPQSALTTGTQLIMFTAKDDQPPHEPLAFPHTFTGTFAVTAP